jgi:hypothetical protein
MSRDKQIKEMAKHCHFYYDGNCILCEELWVECDTKCDMCEFAKQLYNAGYRKASDVAEEIFAEIGKLRPITKLVIKDLGEWDFDKYGEKFYWLSETKLAELKKKYTEEGK